MTQFKNRILTSILTLGVGLAAVSQAHAQGATKGVFTLPFEAQWGESVLKPGTYTLSIPQTTSLPHLLLITGNGQTIAVLEGPNFVDQRPSTSYLKFVSVNGVYLVRQLHLNTNGETIAFIAPKKLRAEANLQAKATEETIPVLSSR